MYVSITATVVGLFSYAPYFAGILKKTVRPSAASWMMWGILTSVAFGVQVSAGGGMGTLITGISALISFIIMGFALRNPNQKFTRLDWCCFIASATAIGLWLFAKNPLLSVLLVSAVTLVGYVPTYYKSYANPEHENATTYSLGIIKFAISIIALGRLSTVTILYPSTVILANIGLIGLLIIRRKKSVARTSSHTEAMSAL